MDDAHTITAEVISLTESEADLRVAGQPLRWPKQLLPADVKQGDIVKLRLLSKITEETDRQERARTLLAEILGGSS